MTREEIINEIKLLLEELNYPDAVSYLTQNDVKWLNENIKALEQEPILDKIRPEIDGLTYYWCEVNPKSVINDVLQIIDKYRGKQNENNNN